MCMSAFFQYFLLKKNRFDFTLEKNPFLVKSLNHNAYHLLFVHLFCIREDSLPLGMMCLHIPGV